MLALGTLMVRVPGVGALVMLVTMLVTVVVTMVVVVVVTMIVVVITTLR